MWKAVLLVCISLSGCHALLNTCSADRCQHLGPDVDNTNPDHLFPSAERLAVICPALHTAFDCIIEEFKECTNMDIEELSASDNETIVGATEIILGTKDLMEDMCDKTTRIHQAWVQNYACMRDTMMAPMAIPLCAFEAKALYGAYKIGEEDDEHEKSCMIAAHVFACISGDMLDNCGEEARATFVELLKRTKFLKHGVCTPQQVADLKTKYIDYLALESTRRSIFEKVFDMRKRK